MLTTADYLVVGSGLTGSTIARVLSDNQREVLLLERRSCLGGNVCDLMHRSRIRVHLHGPHYFRCSSPEIWSFVNRFASFYSYSAKVKVVVNGEYRDWPVTRTVLDQYSGWDKFVQATTPANFEEACLQKMPRPVYEAYVKGYTSKQWGMDPRLLAARLAQRVRINGTGQMGLMPHHVFQGLPLEGYSQMMVNMTKGVPSLLGVDFLQRRSEFHARKALVFTGPIDEYFQFDAGRLGYRAQKRVQEFHPDLDQYQPCAQVNHPNVDDAGLLRTVEWKHLMPPGSRQGIKGTVVTNEYPYSPIDPDNYEYPVPTSENFRLHEHYRRRASTVPKLTVCGRLGTYAYLDMDHAIGIAFDIARRLLTQTTNSVRGAAFASYR